MTQNVNFELSIIIPTYNEADRIDQTLQSLAKYLKGRKEKVEVIVVDADSPDGTAQIARQNTSGLVLQVLSAGPKPKKKAIKGKQVKMGMLAAKGKYILFMDADLATPLSYIDDIFQLASSKKPLAICVRDLQKSHTGIRKFVSGLGNFIVQLLILPGIKDTQCGFKAFRGDVAESIFERQTVMGWGFDMEVLAIARQQGYQIETISVPDWQDVQHNSSDIEKLSGSKFSALKAAFQTLPDVFWIKLGLINGRYKKPIDGNGKKAT